MKSKKIFLETEEEENLSIGLVRLAKDLPDFEFFFNLNKINEFNFRRISDLVFNGTYYTYQFPRFEGYHHLTSTCFQFISNKSSESIQKKQQNQLFLDEQNIKFLLNFHQDVDYILKTSDIFPDFSLILLPENLAFSIQDFSLNSEEELYQLIQYYE